MKLAQTVILDNNDIFQAIKLFINNRSNNRENISGSDVCDYIIKFENKKPYIEVLLTTKDIINGY